MAWAKNYKAKFIEAGLVSYCDSGSGTWLLRKEVIDAMLKSFIGKPVLLWHQKNITAENYSQYACGYVTDAYYNSNDGWYWAEFFITSETAEYAISEGFSVSCAYEVTEWSHHAGYYHQCPYDSEVIAASFLHLALVEAPRYEEALILKNSGGTEDMLLRKNSKEHEAALSEKIYTAYLALAEEAGLSEEEKYNGGLELLLERLCEQRKKAESISNEKKKLEEQAFLNEARQSLLTQQEDKELYYTRYKRSFLGAERYGSRNIK
jgi:hypothetical protein